MAKLFKNVFFLIALISFIAAGILALACSVSKMGVSCISKFERAFNKADMDAMIECFEISGQNEISKIIKAEILDECDENKDGNKSVKLLQGKKIDIKYGESVVPVFVIYNENGKCVFADVCKVKVVTVDRKEYIAE